MQSPLLSSGQELRKQPPWDRAVGLSSSCSALSPTPGAGSWPWGSQMLRCVVPLAPCSPRAGVVHSVAFFFFPSCTIFRRRWTALAQLQRQSSPCQEARCMVTLPASPWQGWESFSRCERTACGSRRLGAGCLGGAARAAPRSPRPGTAATNQTPGGLILPSPILPGFEPEQGGSRMERFSSPPPSSLPPPQQCCGESGDSQSADCSDRWQVISPRANLPPQKKIGLGVIQLLGLKARACRDSVLL